MSEIFKIDKKIPNSLGRAGEIKTLHGVVKTPAFTPVATKGALKGVTVEQVRDYIKAEALLANTYHLHLSPSEETIFQAGGLHKYMNWSGPLFTDSGGFQVFSLGVAFGAKGLSKFASSSSEKKEQKNVFKAKIDEDGVSFRSPINGDILRLNSEISIDIQYKLGADIIFAFDECVAPSATREYQEEALERTHRWAKRSLEKHKELNSQQLLFGIVQGGRYQDLREKSARFLAELPFGGFGIGGSFDKEDMGTAVGWTNSILPENKPRHLLGIGEPEDILAGIENGADTFDCVAPTRRARNGSIYLRNNTKLNLNNSQYRNDFSPLDENCSCHVCQNYTKSYLAHLLKNKEMLGATLCSIHNLYFITKFTADIRQAILAEKFFGFKEKYLRGEY
ncbi:MAG TPA: tRNA guanosine(34) transglycosylase Tgt [Candidatus Vogelbacteria bacterium]|nr:tRNA guanosine(34) transglycosylase Tgt [Candidatus Vogelbacteria bacterium]